MIALNCGSCYIRYENGEEILGEVVDHNGVIIEVCEWRSTQRGPTRRQLNWLRDELPYHREITGSDLTDLLKEMGQ